MVEAANKAAAVKREHNDPQKVVSPITHPRFLCVVLWPTHLRRTLQRERPTQPCKNCIADFRYHSHWRMKYYTYGT